MEGYPLGRPGNELLMGSDELGRGRLPFGVFLLAIVKRATCAIVLGNQQGYKLRIWRSPGLSEVSSQEDSGQCPAELGEERLGIERGVPNLS